MRSRRCQHTTVPGPSNSGLRNSSGYILRNLDDLPAIRGHDVIQIPRVREYVNPRPT